ncbi:SpoIIIAH-like family protein [Haloimpatiens sp. FM7330]|uniref:SpoIIIAH-like family protein n=1 Tax=Haloimpatiens sp. FM7330 TaxID=3298610 RepID=UPI003628A9B3
MNKKQAVIIVALLVLIVSVGLVATKVNGPLIGQEGKDTNEKSAISLNSDEDKKTSSSSYFVEARMVKDQQTTKTLQNLKSIIDDENVEKDQKSKTIEEFNKISTNADKETKIELALKGKGYEDAICTIEDNDKVRVVVKAKEELTEKQSKEIQDVVMGVTKLSDVQIERQE